MAGLSFTPAACVLQNYSESRLSGGLQWQEVPRRLFPPLPSKVCWRAAPRGPLRLWFFPFAGHYSLHFDAFHHPLGDAPPALPARTLRKVMSGSGSPPACEINHPWGCSENQAPGFSPRAQPGRSWWRPEPHLGHRKPVCPEHYSGSGGLRAPHRGKPGGSAHPTRGQHHT